MDCPNDSNLPSIDCKSSCSFSPKPSICSTCCVPSESSSFFTIDVISLNALSRFSILSNRSIVSEPVAPSPTKGLTWFETISYRDSSSKTLSSIFLTVSLISVLVRSAAEIETFIFAIWSFISDIFSALSLESSLSC